MARAFFELVDVERQMQGGSLWKKVQSALHGAGLWLAFVPVFLFCSLQGTAQQLTPIYLGQLVAGQGSIVEGANTTFSGAGGLATSAIMNGPYDVAEDKYGNIYFADFVNCYIYEVAANTNIINIIAGTGVCGANGDGPALTTEINTASSLAFDNSGNLVFDDEKNQSIRKIVFSPNGNTIVSIAGVLATTYGYAGDGAVANTTSTLFHNPYGVAVDKFGNIYIADNANYRIRQISYKTGVINTIAGTGTQNSSGILPANNNIPGTTYGPSASTGNALTTGSQQPYAVNVDAAGNLYWGNYYGMVDMYVPPTSATYGVPGSTPGSLYYIAGLLSGTTGTNGRVLKSCTLPNGTVVTATTISGCAIGSELDDNRNAVSDMKGNIIASDEGDAIRVISNGVITNIAGTFAAYGQLATAANSSSYLTAGMVAPGLSVILDVPYTVRNDWYNNLYVSNEHSYQVALLTYNTNFPLTNVGVPSTPQTIYNEQNSGSSVTLSTAAITPSTEFALGALSGCALNSSLASGTNCQTPITFTPAYPGFRTAQLVFTDSNGNVSPIGLSGIGSAPQASFNQTTFTTLTSAASAPRGGVVDSAGNVYFADSGNNVVRKITPGGVVSIVAGTSGTAGYSGDGSAATSAKLNAPAKVAVDVSGNLFIADTGNNVIREVSASTGYISTVAGNGTAGYTGDNGLATSAELNAPQGVAVDPGGRVYVADTGNNAIRYFGVGGLITTIAGNGTAGYAGDGTPSGYGQLNAPTAVTVDMYGDIYIADTGNDVVRVITSVTNNLATFGNISTFAGQQGQATNSGSGGAATSATLNAPSDVAVDAAGDVYITAGGQIFVVNTANIINKIAGTGATGSYSGDGNSILSTILPAPASNIAIDGAANLYVFDTAANLVLKAPLGTPTTLSLGNTAAGSTGTAQAVVLTNTGNSNLTLSGISTSSADFTIVSAGASACSSTATLAPGQSCTISVAASPASTELPGTVTGTLTVTDNSLNGTNVTHTIPLAATVVVLASTTTSLTSAPTSPVYGSSYTLTAVVTGGSSPTGTMSITLDGASVLNTALPANGTASVNLTAVAAGTHTVVASYSGDANNAASTAQITLTIQQAPLTVTATNATMVAGASVPAFTYTVTGFVNGDTSSVLSGTPAETTTATSSSPSGTYPITISQGTLAAANYSFTFVNGTLTVSATGSTAQTITFNALPGVTYGVAPITLAATSSSNLAVSYTVTGPATISNSVLTITGAGVVTVTASQAGNGTYAPATPVMRSFTVAAAPLTVTASNVSAVYGASNPTLTYTMTGFVNSDTQATAVTGAPSESTTRTAASSVGSYPITVAQGSLAAANYSFTFTAGTFTVTAAPLTVTASSVSAVYGASNPTLTYTMTGFVNSDTQATAVTGAPSESAAGTTASNVGSYSITVAQGTLAAVNYSFTFTAGTFTVTAATLTLTANNASMVYGASLPTFTGTMQGVVNGDQLTATFSTIATSSSAPGTYSIVPGATGAKVGNYKLSPTNGTLTISQAGSIVVLVPSATSGYGGNSITLTATVTPQTSGTPSGQVTFYAGTATLGTAPISGSTATLTTTALPVGTDSVTAVYGGDTNFTGATSAAATIAIAPGFSATPSSAALTLANNQAQTSLAIVPGGRTDTISFSCGSGLPAGMSCAFSPSSLSLSGLSATQTVKVTVSGSSSTASLERPAQPGRLSRSGLALALLPVGGLLFLGAFRRRMRALLFALLLALGIGTTMTGCGGQTSFQYPPATYVFTVNVNSGSTTLQSVPLTLDIPQ